MTYQEFNHIYYKFTKKHKGIRPMDKITTNGYELKEFLEFAMENMRKQKDNQLLFNGFDF